MAISLNLLTPRGVVYKDEVDSILLPTVDGPLGIEPGYTNIIVSLVSAGVLKVDKAGKSRYFAVFGGLCEMTRDHGCVIACEEVNDGYEIDMARAIAARDRNLDLIAKNADLDSVKLAKIKLAKALARIDAKELSLGKGRN